MIDYGTRLIVNKSNFHDVVIKEDNIPSLDILEKDEVVLKLNKFAYTANNITYAMVGEQIGYWKFFPIKEEGFGIIPCWGFADVVVSRNKEISEGSRFYGFFPMATHLIVKPGRISNRGFLDVAEHRQNLPVIYNQYVDCKSDPLYSENMEAFHALFRPLFTTSFLIHDQLTQNKFYDAQQIILISASSKTGLSLASCLKDEGIHVVGLTSARNVDFVKSTGYYNDVIDYEAIPTISKSKTVIVDFAGNHMIQLQIQKHLAGSISNICMVGMVRWEKHDGAPPLPVKPELFFAPTYAARRIKELGHEEYTVRLMRKYNHFMKDAEKRLIIKLHKGVDALVDIHHKITEGNMSASDGHIVSF